MKLATESDLAALVKIHAASFEERWDEAALHELLAAPGTFALIAGEGFVLIRLAADEAEILTLAVAPPSRRTGLGRALVVDGATEADGRGAKHMFLEVSTANLAALALYAGLGFREVGRRAAYYRAPQGDALILRADLPLAAPALGNSRQTD
jgi:[ribosomal protein S18]-alanine N-acetyltransferase